MIWAAIWYWLLVAFTAADVITTRIALAMGMHEANPFMAPVIEHMILVKAAYLIGMVAAIWWFERVSTGDGWLAPCAATCVTSVAVTSNFIQLLLYIQ